MPIIYATSEFTDIKNTDWKINIVKNTVGSDSNLPFNLGPDGFNLTYDFEEYDRCKPVVGSRVQITLFHPIANSVFFDAFYNFLDSDEEGKWRIEIYRDPDSTNEFWWAGAIMPEQTVIPDDYPHAPVTITAVDGLANLKGIDYNNDGTAYTGTALVLEHLHNLIQKLHISDVWSATDVELKFFEDYIGKEYKDYIAGAQNKQLENANISHEAYYNKDSNGIKQYFSSYEVLESLAITFNVSVFMAQGSIWWVPLGAIQSHASSGTSIANYILGDGTRTYNTVANVTTGAIFGSNSAQWEKLNGWERTSAPAFKEVKRTRNYQGDHFIIQDSNYTQAQIVASEVLSDEDIEYLADERFIISGTLMYSAGSFGYITPDLDRLARVKVDLTIKVGDAGGTTNYLKSNYDFDTTYPSVFWMWDYLAPPHYPQVYPLDAWDNVTAALPNLQDGVSWDSNPSTFTILTSNFDKSTGTRDITDLDPYTFSETNLGSVPLNGFGGLPFSFASPGIPANASGLQISAALTGVDWEGVEDTSIKAATNAYGAIQYRIDNLRITKYSEAQAQEFSSIDIIATNPDNARYDIDQGTTLIGDLTSDFDLGTIKINNGTSYVNSSEWTNLQSSTASLSINGLGVRERLASNENAKRIERGTLYRRGSTYIHPYTILTNSSDSGNFYQVTGLKYIANRCEYDIECMYLSRNITGITVSEDNPGGKGPTRPPDVLPTTKGPSQQTTILDNSTKLGFVTTDTYGITKVTTSTGSSALDVNLPVTKAGSGEEIVTINTLGAMAPLADGASGEFLKTNGSGVLSWAAAGGGGGGWFGSTTLLKVMPTEWIMNDDYTRGPVVVEDDVTNVLGIRAPSAANELYAFKAIPTGYKATHVQVYTSQNVTNGVEVLSFNQSTGSTASKGTGDFNTLIDITDITSGASTNICIKLLPNSPAIVIYGADITIVAV